MKSDREKEFERLGIPVVRCGGDFEAHYKLAAYKDTDGSIVIETKDGKTVRLKLP